MIKERSLFGEDLPAEPIIDQELRKKREGMARAANKNSGILDEARRIAVELGIKGGDVNIDDVREEMAERGIEFVPGNWLGSVFKGKCWSCVCFRFSRHEGGHAHTIRAWIYKGGSDE